MNISNIVVKGIIDSLWENLGQNNGYSKIHMLVDYTGLNCEYVPEGMVNKDNQLILNITPHAIGGITFGEDTITVKCAYKGKRTEVTVVTNTISGFDVYDVKNNHVGFYPLISHLTSDLINKYSDPSKWISAEDEDTSPKVDPLAHSRSKLKVVQ